jgi:hypothetical protein
MVPCCDTAFSRPCTSRTEMESGFAWQASKESSSGLLADQVFCYCKHCCVVSSSVIVSIAGLSVLLVPYSAGSGLDDLVH